jgi:hypothetical protein
MPALSNILAQIAASLRDNGAQFAPRVLDMMSAATTFLLATGNATDSDIAAASYLATQLRSNDARKAAVALGISPDLIPALSPTSVGLDAQLAQVLARGTPAQALVAATVLFSWHAISARTGDPSRMAALQDAASIATLQGSQNSALAQTLVTEMAKASLSTRPGPVSSDCLFSISIDLVGSTDAKTRMMKVAHGDPKKVDELNAQIYREFCRIERKFYEGAVNHYGAVPPIDPAKFFTVKGIGDEIWILCDASAADVPQVGTRLIDTAIEVARQSVRFLAIENDDGPSFDRNHDYGNIEPILSPIKMFIDLLAHGSDLGRLRDEALVKTIPDLLKTYHRREPTPLEIVSGARRMSLSGYEPVGWWDFHEFRTDYIGHEIDRFFRTTKSAIPGTVTIGASMARAMGLGFKPTMQGIHAVFTNGGAPLTGGVPPDPVHARIRTFKPDELKGIGYAYDTYTLFAPRTLSALYVQMEADKRNEIPAMPYHDTAALIPPDAVDDLVKKIVKQ